MGVGGQVLAAVPVDLAAVVAATLLADAVILLGGPTPLRLAAAVPLLFFLPGYALVAGLYPEPADADAVERFHGVGFGERLALSFGASLALLPLLALAVWAAGLWGSSVSLALALTGVVLVGSVVGATRRLLRPPARRFSVTPTERLSSVGSPLDSSLPATDRALNVVLAVAVVLAVGSLGYGLLAPASGAGETYTSATLLTRSDGELVAADYPSELQPGESAELVLELANHEGTDQAYTVVVRAERVETDGESTTVTAAEEVDRLSVQVGAGETETVPHEVATSVTGERVRLSYYVYRGDAPSTPDAESAYRHLYIWTSVGA